jgi:hypothetical protein
MNTIEEQIILTDEEKKLIEYKLYKKNYNKQRYNERKEEIKEHQKQYYINKVSTDPEFRDILAKRTKTRYYRNKEPKLLIEPTIEPNIEQPIKKIGRPRKY